MDFKRDPFMAKPYDYNRGDKVIPSATMFNSGGNEFLTLIIHDAIRNYREKSFSFVDHMEKGFISNHKFSIIRNTFFNDQLVYEISIKYRNNGYLAKGKIHINKNTFAIHKLDYSLCIQKLMRPSNYAETPEVFDNERGHADAGLIYQIITEYLPGEDQKLFLNYISFRNKFILKRPPIFAVTKFVIDLDDKCFKVTLNRRPRDLDKVRKKDFKFLYKEKELPIEKFRFEEDSLRFWVYPDTLVASLQNEMEELFTETDSLRISNFYYNFKNIKDSLGNNLDERSSENLEQYREFFVQDILTKIDSEPGDVIFMNRELPLFSPFQPVYSEKRNHKYWMNTPLQKTED
jgi:hypothetical protein